MRRRGWMGGLALAAVALAASGEARARAHYVFAYFVDNGQDGLHLAYSRDGLDWLPLNGGESVLAPTAGGKLMRDPHILLGPDGQYHMVWTTGWAEQGIGIAHSKDLRAWSEQRFLPLMVHERRAVNCWAPEIFYDDVLQHYMIFWATTIPGRFPATDQSGTIRDDGTPLNHRFYRTTTKDFETYTPAELFFDPGFNAIDATLVRDGRQILMFLKDETSRPEVKKHIRVASADHAIGPYVLWPDAISADWVEGPTALRIDKDLYVYVDAYRRERFEGVKSRDLKTWVPITDALKMPPGARHGSILSVPEKIAEGLLSKPKS